MRCPAVVVVANGFDLFRKMTSAFERRFFPLSGVRSSRVVIKQKELGELEIYSPSSFSRILNLFLIALYHRIFSIPITQNQRCKGILHCRTSPSFHLVFQTTGPIENLPIG